MSTITIPWTITNGQPNDGSQVDDNFDAIKSYLDGSVILKDGSIALTGLLSGPAGTDPTVDDHLARKKYVDDRVGRKRDLTTGTHTLTAFNTYENISTTTITNPAKAVTVTAWAPTSIVAGSGSATCFFQVRVGISFNNGSSYTYGDVASASGFGPGDFGFFTPMHQRAGTPTGNIKIILDMYQQLGFVNLGNCPRSTVYYDMAKEVTN